MVNSSMAIADREISRSPLGSSGTSNPSSAFCYKRWLCSRFPAGPNSTLPAPLRRQSGYRPIGAESCHRRTFGPVAHPCGNGLTACQSEKSCVLDSKLCSRDHAANSAGRYAPIGKAAVVRHAPLALTGTTRRRGVRTFYEPDKSIARWLKCSCPDGESPFWSSRRGVLNNRRIPGQAALG